MTKAIYGSRAWAVVVDGSIDLRTLKPSKTEAMSEWLGVEKDLYVNPRRAEQVEAVWGAMKGNVQVLPVRVEVES